MNMTIHNFKVAVRNLMKYKLQVTISVLSIAIGIVTLALVHAYLTKFRFPSICNQPYYERTYSLSLVSSDAQNEEATDSTDRDTPPTIRINQDIVRALKRDGGLKTAERIAVPNNITFGDIMKFVLCDSTKRKFNTGITPVDPEYIPLVGLRSAITGQPVKKLQSGEAVISQLKASLIFGNANPVGAVCFDINGMHPMPLTIVDVFENVSFEENFINNRDMYFSIGEAEDVWHSTQRNMNLYHARNIKIVLREGCTESQLMAELNERLAPFGHTLNLERESDNVRSGRIINTQFFTHLAGSLILLAAIIGFLRMQVQLFWMRRREVSLRMVNGAKRGQLFRLLFAEVSIVVVQAVAVAMMMGIWAEDFVYTRLTDPVYIELYGIGGFARYSLYIGGLLLLVCGLVIWLTLMRICNAEQGLAANMRNSRTHLFRNVMLGLQISICIIFVCSALTIADWGGKMMGLYNMPDDLRPYKESILLNMDAASTGAEALKREIGHLPSLEKMMAHRYTYIGVQDLKEDKIKALIINDMTCEPFFHTTDTSLIDFLQCKVNWFDKPVDRSECLILNEDLYKKLREQGIAGNDMLTVGSHDKYTLPIAGTIPGLPYGIIPASILIHPDMADRCREFVLVPRKGKYHTLMHEVDSVIRSMEPSVVNKMAQNFHESHTEITIIETMRQTGWLLAAVSIIICAMSIYSAIALDTRSRKKEVAIRKVNGAKSGDIYRLFGRLYFVLVGIALAVALPVLMEFHKFFYSDYFPDEIVGTCAFSVGLFAAGSLIVIAMIAAIVAWNIRGIMRTNPSEIIAKE